MKVVEEGTNELFMDPDPDKARSFFQKKSRAMTDKRTTVKEAVEKFIPNGCYLGIGGFGANRIPTAVLHEILRQNIPRLMTFKSFARGIVSTALMWRTLWAWKRVVFHPMHGGLCSPARSR